MLFLEVIQPDPAKRDNEVVQALRIATHHGLSVQHCRDTERGIALFCSVTGEITREEVDQVLAAAKRGARRCAARPPESAA